MSQENSVIMQTSNALNQCCMGDSKFKGSVEQVECNRLLLVACKYLNFSECFSFCHIKFEREFFFCHINFRNQKFCSCQRLMF